MSLTVANTGGDFKPAPAGSHLARCYRIIDLGTQKVVWKGTEKAMKKIIIGWELHGEDADGKPLLTDVDLARIAAAFSRRSVTRAAHAVI